MFSHKCRLSPCEWSQPLNEQNTFSFLHSLWYTAGGLTLQGKQPQDSLYPRQKGEFQDPMNLLICFFVVLVCVVRRWSSPKSSVWTRHLLQLVAIYHCPAGLLFLKPQLLQDL